MKVRVKGPGWILLALWIGCEAAVPLWAADGELPASAILENKGLVSLSRYYALPGEAEFAKMLREVRGVERKMKEADQRLELIERKIDTQKQLIVQYTQQRRLLRQGLAQAGSIRQRNQLAVAINELGDRITLLMQGGEDAEPLKNARAEASQAREEYAEHILELGRLSAAIAQQYESLAADPQVKAALREVNASSDTAVQLGPTPSFVRNRRSLEKLEQTVLSDAVELRRGPGNLLYVVAYFNGQHAQEIAVDTGASILLLPETVARKAGVQVDPDAASIQLRVADGSTIDAYEATVDRVRVGKFTVEDVPCAVLGDQYSNAPPLLGQSFLGHFVYKVDPNQGKLFMTQVKGDAAP